MRRGKISGKMSAIILWDEIVHYEVLGRGRPVIFLHDWVGSWRYWIPCMQATSTSFRTYALDLWGFGDSGKNPAYYSLEQQVGLIDEFMAKMGIARAALVGHGLGAIIAMLYASRRPQMVDRLMAVGLPVGEGALNARLRLGQAAELAEWLLGRSPAYEAAWMDAPKVDTRAILLSLASLEMMDLKHTLDQLSTPCLLVYGQADALVQAPPLEALALLPQQAHAILFEQSGHFPMLDEPSKFNRLLNDFLSLPSGESPRQLQLKEEWKRRVR